MPNPNSSAMTRWLVIGTVMQLIMVISGHYDEFIAANVFAIGGMTISLIAGAGYAMSAGNPRGAAALGGLLVGGGCALLGIMVSVFLGDTAMLILLIGTVSSAVTGAIGGFAVGAMRGAKGAAA